MSDRKIFTFPGEEMDVHWDGRLCIHIGECGQSAGELFVGGRDPWCMPDNAGRAEVAEVCERCPSGALTYTDKTGELAERAPAANTIQVIYNGPLYALGRLAIEGASQDMAGVRYRAALCRCGRSNNKPFCDNSHLQAGFQDYGAIGEQGPGAETTGGELEIRPLANGPLLVSGGVTLVAGSGRSAWQGDKAALCRCGASRNKPFCDGSHKEAGFRSD